MNNDELQQKLWELVYDLLPDDEAQELTDRITSDPDVARAYAEVKLHCDVLSEALRAPVAEVRLPVPAINAGTEQPHTIATITRATKEPSPPKRSSAWGNWMVVTAASLLACALSISLGGYSWFSYRAAQLAGEPLVQTTVVAPREMTSRAAGAVTVLTRNADNTPVSTEVEIVGKASDESVWFAKSVQTDSYGVAVVDIPPPAEGNEFDLLVRTAESKEDEIVRGRIRLNRRPPLAFLQTDRFMYASSEPARARAVVLDRATGQPAGPLAVDFLTDGQSTGPTRLTEQGVASAEIALPTVEAEHRLSLFAVSPNGEFEPAQRSLVVIPPQNTQLNVELEFGRSAYRPGDTVTLDAKIEDLNGQPASGAEVLVETAVGGEPEQHLVWTNSDGQVKAQLRTPAVPQMKVNVTSRFSQLTDYREVPVPVEAAVPVPVEAAAAEVPPMQVHFYPEGGHLIPNVPNRVYFQVLSDKQQPIEASGRILNEQGETVTPWSTRSELQVGRGVFEITPESDGRYHTVIDEPAGATAVGDLQPAAGSYFVSLQADEAVIGPNESLRMRVMSTGTPRTMVLVATCRGMEVGHARLEVYGSAEPVLITVPLSPHAEGAIRVTLFDYGSSPYRVLAERLVFRQPQQRLHIEVADAPASDGRQQYRVLVKNDRGEPATATLGASIIAIPPGTPVDKTPGLPAYFWLLSEAVSAPWEDVNAYLENTPHADQQLEFLLGVQPWRYAETADDLVALSTAADPSGSLSKALSATSLAPPHLLENDAAINARMAQIDTWRSWAHQWIAFSGRLVLLLGAVTLVITLLVAGLQRATVRFWGTALGFSATVLLIVGLFVGGDIMQETRGVAAVTPSAESVATDTAQERPADFAGAPTDQQPEPRSLTESGERLPRDAEGQTTMLRDGTLGQDTTPSSPFSAPQGVPTPRTRMRSEASQGSGGLGSQSADAAMAANGLESLTPEIQTEGLRAGGADMDMGVESLSDGTRALPPTPAAGMSRERSFSHQAVDEAQPITSAYYFRVKDARRSLVRMGREPDRTRSNPLLFWDPVMAVHAGTASFEFQIPPEVQQWQLIVTAHGEQGIGELRQHFGRLDHLSAQSNVALQDRYYGKTTGSANSLSLPYGAKAQARPSPAPIGRGATLREPDPLAQTETVGPERSLENALGASTLGHADYSLVVHLAGELTETAHLAATLPNHVPGTPVTATVRVYPSLAAEILDGAQALVIHEPTLRTSTFAALERVQGWLNEHQVPDVDVMGGINARLRERPAGADWHTELAANVNAASGNYQLAIQGYLASIDNSSDSTAVLSELANQQAEDGHVPCDTTFTGSGGSSQLIETTAMSVLAWSPHEQFAENAQRALAWLRQQRTGDGGWATEEARALALMALCTDQQSSVMPRDAVELGLIRGDQDDPLTIPIDSPQPAIWRLQLTPGDNQSRQLTLNGPPEQSLWYVAQFNYAGNKPAPASSNLRISTELSAATAEVGDRVQLHVVIEGRAEPVVAVRIPLPAGLKLERYPLPEHGWFEGDLMLYFESPFRTPKEWVQHEERLESWLPLIVERSGTLTAPAARVYPSHRPEQTSWAAPLKINVQQ